MTPVWEARLSHNFITIRACTTKQEKKSSFPCHRDGPAFMLPYQCCGEGKRSTGDQGLGLPSPREGLAGDGVKQGLFLAHVLGMRCFLWAGSHTYPCVVVDLLWVWTPRWCHEHWEGTASASASSAELTL